MIPEHPPGLVGLSRRRNRSPETRPVLEAIEVIARRGRRMLIYTGTSVSERPLGFVPGSEMKPGAC